MPSWSMATEEAHLLKASNNKAFMAKIGEQDADWLAVVAFYTSVHLVEALLAHRPIPRHSTCHEDRNDWLREHHPSLWREFKPLHDISRLVRYTERSVPLRDVQDILIAKRLTRVEEIVREALATPVPRIPSPLPPRPRSRS